MAVRSAWADSCCDPAITSDITITIKNDTPNDGKVTISAKAGFTCTNDGNDTQKCAFEAIAYIITYTDVMGDCHTEGRNGLRQYSYGRKRCPQVVRGLPPSG